MVGRQSCTARSIYLKVLKYRKNISQAIARFYSTTMESSDKKCVICSLVLQEAILSTCGHFLCRDCFIMRRNNDTRCPVDNEPSTEAEVAGGQLSEVRLSSQELQHLTRPVFLQQTQQLSYPIQEQHPNLQPRHFREQVSRPGEAGIAGRPRPGDEGNRLPYQPDDGNQASGWSGFSTLCGQGGSQRTSEVGLLLGGYQQAEGGLDRYRSRFNVPTVEQGQDASQRRYRRNGSQNGAISAKQKELVTEDCCDTREIQLWNENQQRLRLFEEAMMSQIEGRFCHGTYHWRIRNFHQCRQDAITGVVAAQFSPAIYTDLYGYTFCMRIYLNGVNSGVCTHVALYVHMMQGEYDHRLSWPFTGVVTLSILDQSGAEVPEDITQVLVASPKLCAFKRPTAPCSPIGCGYEMFAPIAQICAGPFIKNDTMLVKIEISR